MEDETQKADLILYRGGSLVTAYDRDSCRIYNLESERCIYEGEQEVLPYILSDYFVLTAEEQQQIFDKNGSEVTVFPGRVKEAENWIFAIVEKDGKQGLYGLEQ